VGLVGASAALAGAAGCGLPGREEAVVPYTRRPEEIVPGVANWYATTYQEGPHAHSLLVKTREGRPIHIEGNDLHPHAGGKATSRAQAQIISLYDPERPRTPLVDGEPAAWGAALGRLHEALRQARNAGRPVLLLTGAVLSPSARALIDELKRALPTLRHVQWEPAADHASRLAALACFGEAVLPRRRFDRARVVLSFEDDFLGDGDDPGAIAGFAEARRVRDGEDPMSRLWVVEGRMSLTGSNADHRLPLRPTRAAALAFALAREIHEAHHIGLPRGVSATALKGPGLEEVAGALGLETPLLRRLAADLAGHAGEALVLAGPALPHEAHVACHLLNAMLGAEGRTLDSNDATRAPDLATSAEMGSLAAEIASGTFEAALFWNVNPCYGLPDAAAWKEAVARVPMSAALAAEVDESALACKVLLPVHHWMEAWGDCEPALDIQCLQQPVVSPLHDTRQAEDLLLGLARGLQGETATSYRDFIKKRWEEVQPPGSPLPFESFWNAALHDGLLVRRQALRRGPRRLRAGEVATAARDAAGGGEQQGRELILYADSKVGDGRHAANGWLQELPEPVNKTVWGNALLISVADARREDIEDGSLVEVSVAGRDSKVTLPALVQPGQAEGVLSAALGYGRETGSVAAGVGVSLYPLMGDATPYLRTTVQIAKAGGKGPLVRTQEHHSLHGRDHARSLDLNDYAHHGLGHGSHHPEGDLYPKPQFPGHHWGMVIDLNACVGCSGCVIACQSENNVPVVGPEQVDRGREMAWIRLDRYYEGDPGNPEVVHQPMLCQQCDKAPCENVCPVNATTHSPEGLNQMAYNRCVGTRYCANNCPYKVRRFNFFDFYGGLREPMDLAFNPEVSVRPRGVMEKCSFCVQRIEDARARARVEGRDLADGEVRPACAVACPAEAIVFGDLNDPEGRLAKLWGNDRGYRVLQADLGVDPSITYLARLRNPAGEDDSHGS